MAGYMGLLMGCSRPYWIGILQKIYKTYGSSPWSWNDIRKNFPEISNSDMRRLNCSNWFVKAGKDNKTSLWKLQPDAVNICKLDLSQAQSQVLSKKSRIKSAKR